MTTLAGCAVLALLELDATLAVQTLASRPLVSGGLLGALSGAPQTGFLLGAVFELLSLSDLPVGGCLTWSAPVAAGTAALLAGRGVSFPFCLAAGVFAGAAHSRLEARERARRAAVGGALAERAARGEGLGAAMAASLAGHAAMTAALAFAVVSAGAAFDRSAWAKAPEFARAGAALAAGWAPWLGLSGVALWGLKR